MPADSELIVEHLAPSALTRIAYRFLSRFLRLPPSSNRYSVDYAIRIEMRDGIELIADHYVPNVSKPAHTVLVRSPYGRRYPFPQFYAGPLAARGFHVVVQSVRGTYGSGGAFEPAIHEAADGHDTVAWLRRQPWFTGRVATIGASYLGLVQWALMVDPPPELAAAVILAAPHDLSAAWATGSFALDDNLRFCHGVARPGERARMSSRVRNLVIRRHVDDVETVVPLSAGGRAALGAAAPLYESWLSHPDRDDPFWNTQRFNEALDNCRVPVLLVNGWQDTFIRQTFEQYQKLRQRGVDVGLTIGPWTHDRLLRKGARTFIADALDWITSRLGEGGHGNDCEPVRTFVTGHGWIQLPDWPPKMPRHTLFLQPLGGLATKPPSSGLHSSSFTFDPVQPTPTVGGPLLVGGGYCDDTALAARTDVLSFDSAKLGQDLHIVGSPVAQLIHSADNAHVDVFVRISELHCDGRSTNVTEGLRRLSIRETNHPIEIDIELDPIAHRFVAGSRIRVLIAGGSHPRFARHTGTTEPLATAQRLVPATHHVHHGTSGTSRLLLPASRELPG